MNAEVCRAILDAIRSGGGTATLHCRDLGLDRGEYMAALSHLKEIGRIQRVGPATWKEVVRYG